MAQHFQIPVAFEFKPFRTQWLRAEFQIERQTRQAAGAFVASADVPASVHEELYVKPLLRTASLRREVADRSRVFTPQPSQLAIHFEVAHELRQCGSVEPASLREVLVSLNEGLPDERSKDAWTMRAEFLALPEDTLALQRFFNRWGVWDRGTLEATVTRFNITEFIRLREERRLGCISPFVVWRERKRLKEGMLMPPDTWLSNNAALSLAMNRKVFPFVGTEVNVCLRAMEATITFDHLRNVKSRLCSRPDCDAVFTVDSKHGKVYCGQYCAHLESVRRNRAAAKKSVRPARKASK